jgi:hypothetical protein
LQYFYSHFRINIWTEYGYRDAFNIGQGWYDTDELGIDQGPIVIMIENYRSRRYGICSCSNAEIQRGLQRAGFVQLPFMGAQPAIRSFARDFQPFMDCPPSGRYYQSSTRLTSSTGFPSRDLFQATHNSGSFTWFDTGPPVTASLPLLRLSASFSGVPVWQPTDRAPDFIGAGLTSSGDSGGY